MNELAVSSVIIKQAVISIFLSLKRSILLVAQLQKRYVVHLYDLHLQLWRPMSSSKCNTNYLPRITNRHQESLERA